MKAADRSGARVAIIVGEHEAQTGTVAIRDMSGATDQQSISRNEAVEYIHRLLNP
jgi:histidyl-tRNA synthetase